MKQATYLVVYKDNHDAPTMYFGPFVSIQVADDFSKALPKPLESGYKKYGVIQPFTHNEATLVSDLIATSRERQLQLA